MYKDKKETKIKEYTTSVSEYEMMAAKILAFFIGGGGGVYLIGPSWCAKDYSYSATITTTSYYYFFYFV